MVAMFWWDKVGNEFESANGDPYRAIMGVTGKLAAQTKPGEGVRAGYLEKSGIGMKLVTSPTETEVELGDGPQIRRKLQEMLPSKAVAPRHRDILIPEGYRLFMHGKPSEIATALAADMASGLRALARFQEKLEMRWLRYMKPLQTDTIRTILGVGGPTHYWRLPLAPETGTHTGPRYEPGTKFDERGWMRGRIYDLEGYDAAKGGVFSAVTLSDLHGYVNRLAQ